jgi:hypothetical protein
MGAEEEAGCGALSARAAARASKLPGETGTSSTSSSSAATTCSRPPAPVLNMRVNRKWMHAQESQQKVDARARKSTLRVGCRKCWNSTTHALRARGVRARVGVGGGAGPARHRPERLLGYRRGCLWKSCARPGKAGSPRTVRAPRAAASLGVTRRAQTTRGRADGGAPRRRRQRRRCRCPPAAPLGSFVRLKETPGRFSTG